MSGHASSLQLVKTSGVSSMPAARLVPRQLVRDTQIGPSQKDELSTDVLTKSVGTLVAAEAVRVARSIVESERRLEAFRVALDDSCRGLAVAIGVNSVQRYYHLFEVFGDQRIKSLNNFPSALTLSDDATIDLPYGLIGDDHEPGLWTILDPDLTDVGAVSPKDFESYIHPLNVINRVIVAARPAALPPADWDE